MFNSKQQGVSIPQNQGRKTGLPNTIANAVKCEMVIVRYFDEFGREKDGLVIEIGGKLYDPPNAETWVRALKGCRKWMNDAVYSKLDTTAASCPDDTVDVVTG